MEKNIYIENREEIKAITDGGRQCDIGVQLDIFDRRHEHKKDERARAEYMNLFHPEMMSVKDKRLLEDGE